MGNRRLDNVVRHIRRTVAARQAREIPDRELLERFVTRRDEDAFAAIVKQHGSLVLGVCRRILRNDHDAEDACQATFLVLTRNAGTIRKGDSLASWLYGVASRIALKLRGRVQRTRAEDVSAVQVAGPDIVGEITWREGLAVLDEELSRLPAAYRSALIVCYLQGRKQTDAARELGCSLGALCGRLVRGRELLRKRLARRGLPLPAAVVGVVLVSVSAQAALPRALAVRMVKAAAALLAGQPLARFVPPTIAALTEGALTSMFVSRAKTIGSLVLIASLIAMGAGMLAGAAGNADQGPPTKEAPLARPPQGAKDNRPTDALGDALPPGAVARLGTVRWRHSSPVTFLALPNATTAISAAKDRFVRVWDWSSGKELRQFGPGPRARESTDGFVVLGRPTEMVVAVSADGKVLATKFDEPVVNLWQVATGKKGGSVSLSKTDVRAVGLALSPNGKQLALYSTNGNVRIWDIAAEKIIREFGQAADKSTRSVAVHYTPDGKCLVGVRTELDAAVGHMHLWDPETGRQLRSLRLTSRFGHLAVVCSPDSKLLAYALDEQICVVKTNSGKKVSQWKTFANAMVFAADSSKLYCKLGHEAVIREYDVGTGKELRCFDAPSLPSFYWRQDMHACSLALSPDGKRLAVGGDTNVIRVVDIETGKELPVPGGVADDLRHVGFMPDGKSVFSAANLGASIWYAGTGKRLKQMRSEDEMRDGHFAVSMDSRYLATVGPKRTIVVRDTASNKPVATIPPAKNPDNYPVFCFSPDGRVLLVRRRHDKFAALHDLPSGKERCRIAIPDVTGTPGSPSDTFFFSADGSRLAIFSAGNRLAVRDATNGKSLQEITLDLDAVDNIVRWERRLRVIRSAAFAPDGRAIAIDCGDGTVQLLELASAQERRTFGKKHPFPELKEPFGGFWSKAVESQMPGAGTVTFSPDGRLLAQAAVDHVVVVWDVATGKSLARFQGHRGPIFSVAFSPDGRRLVSGSADTTALIWDIAGLSARAGPPPRALGAAAAQAHWNNLSAQAPMAADAMNALVTSPAEAVSLCKAHLQAVPAVDAPAVTRLIDQLGSDTFKMREQAQAELLALGDVVVPYLEKALAGNSALETRQRLEKLHAKLTAAVLTGDRLRLIRAIEVLERIGNAQARQLLQVLAGGAPGALITTQARAALQRAAKTAHQAKNSG
jgi:RNA polymerase sigma factor (sigma-70 family)